MIGLGIYLVIFLILLVSAHFSAAVRSFTSAAESPRGAGEKEPQASCLCAFFQMASVSRHVLVGNNLVNVSMVTIANWLWPQWINQSEWFKRLFAGR